MTLDWQYQMWMEFGNAFREEWELSDAKDAFSHAMQLCDRVGANEMQRRHESSMALSDILFKMRDWQGAETVHRQFLLLRRARSTITTCMLAEQRAMLVCCVEGTGKGDRTLNRYSRKDSPQQPPRANGNGGRDSAMGSSKLGRLFDAKDAFSRALELSEGLAEQRVERQIQSAWNLCDVLGILRDWQAAEMIVRQDIRFADGKPNKDLGLIASP